MRTLTPQAPHDGRRKGLLHFRGAVLALLAAAAIVGCQAAAPAATSTAVPSAAPSGISLVDDEGTEVTLADVPDEIVSLTPATTELLFALGSGDRLVGRTDFDDFPPEAAEIPAVATFQGVQVEKIVDIEPDLILAGGNSFTPPGDVARMRELGFAVLVLYANDVDGVLADIQLVGRAVGAENEAEVVVRQLEARIDEVTAAVAELDTPRVFYEIGNEPELYGPAPDSFVADMVSLAGGDPITTGDPAVFNMPVERLVEADPEVIVLGDAAYGVCPDAVVSRPGWGTITAVRDGAVRPVDDIIVTRPGPRLGEGLAALALAIHPAADIAPPTSGRTLCATGITP